MACYLRRCARDAASIQGDVGTPKFKYGFFILSPSMPINKRNNMSCIHFHHYKWVLTHGINGFPWVTPSHVVPKTHGINVKKNEKGEEVQT